MKRWRVTVYRRNGRWLKDRSGLSKYAAKQLQDEWEEKYEPHGFYVEVVKLP